jgi:hypothetical protein
MSSIKLAIQVFLQPTTGAGAIWRAAAAQWRSSC